ncbi:MAG: hypothetical protein R3C28_02055 [Pirellulaceae bacterium]
MLGTLNPDGDTDTDSGLVSDLGWGPIVTCEPDDAYLAQGGLSVLAQSQVHGTSWIFGSATRPQLVALSSHFGHVNIDVPAPPPNNHPYAKGEAGRNKADVSAAAGFQIDKGTHPGLQLPDFVVFGTAEMSCDFDVGDEIDLEEGRMRATLNGSWVEISFDHIARKWVIYGPAEAGKPALALEELEEDLTDQESPGFLIHKT